jgi:uncharacterized protein with GYD domain
MGVTDRSVCWTIGNHDRAVIVEGPDEAAMAALMKAGSPCNVRSQTLRAFSVDEMNRIPGKMP